MAKEEKTRFVMAIHDCLYNNGESFQEGEKLELGKNTGNGYVSKEEAQLLIASGRVRAYSKQNIEMGIFKSAEAKKAEHDKIAATKKASK